MNLNNIVKLLNDPWLLFYRLGMRGILNFLNDKLFLEICYKLRFDHKLNLNNPTTFNEKLQWLKLYDRRPEYTTMVDKFAVKKYVADKIGNQYIIPTLGVWDRFDYIDFDSLPEQFVLKCTHDSGSVAICRSKVDFDRGAAQKKLTRALKRNYYYSGREWPYKNVIPRIIAEEYMKDESATELCDYKFYCFNGKVKFLYISTGSHTSEQRICYLYPDWTQLNILRDDYQLWDKIPPKPLNFNVMIKYAELLSEGIPFLRVDFYEINKLLYFGELTFYPGSGFTRFIPEEADYKMGTMLNLPKDKRK